MCMLNHDDPVLPTVRAKQQLHLQVYVKYERSEKYVFLFVSLANDDYRMHCTGQLLNGFFCRYSLITVNKRMKRILKRHQVKSV